MVATPLLFLAAVMVERGRTKESLRKTSARLIDAMEQERHRIARELHDDLGQKLVLLHMDLERIQGKCEEWLRPSLTDLLSQLSTLSTTAREISHGLHPSELEYLGLVAAAKRLCKHLGQGTSLSIQLNARGVPVQLQPAISLCLYRVIQEGLHNIVTHSRASKAEIDLTSEGERVLLRIVDDGIGFTPGQEPTSGLGLVSMRERVRSVGGSIDIASSPMRGTQIEAWVPVHEDVA
jgi:signal transduction histidine kinase